jgi:hypothetical protein
MKIACVYHSVDLDGWMSASIVKHWFVSEYGNDHIESRLDVLTKDEVFLYKGGFDTLKLEYPSIVFVGYNYGQPVPDLSGYDKVIMCDISFPDQIMSNLNELYGSNFVWIDHHISAMIEQEDTFYKKLLSHVPYNEINGIRDTKFAACELTWKYFFPNDTVPEIVRLLGRYDCFGHKGTSEELKVLEFQYGARQEIFDYQEAYKWLTICLKEEFREQDLLKAGHFIYGYLCTEAKQSYRNGFELRFDDNHDGWPRKFICINKERFNPINFGIDYHADGWDGAACFHRRADGKWAFSLYNDNDEVDCSVIAKQFGGGGHKGASGFVVDDINSIIK